MNSNADGFLTRNVSLGPLLQLAFTGDMTQVGFSGQAKYWIAIPDTGNRAKLVLQAGLGFVHADFLRSDTSWLIPLGVGLDYAVHRSLSLTTTFLLNFTDLDTGPGTHTNVMPGLTFGVRFQPLADLLAPSNAIPANQQAIGQATKRPARTKNIRDWPTISANPLCFLSSSLVVGLIERLIKAGFLST